MTFDFNQSEHSDCRASTYYTTEKTDSVKMPIDVSSYLYAAAVAGGGIFGYVKAGKI